MTLASQGTGTLRARDESVAAYREAEANLALAKARLAKATITGGKPGTLEPTIATKVATGVDAPVPLTFSPQGDLVVGQMGEINVPGDALLTVYDPKSGELKSSAKMGLNDPTGLAYSPKTGKLYVLDFSWIDTTKGGLFRLDVDGDTVKATQIVRLDKPTAMAFDADGKLYISVYGTAREGSDRAPGRIVVIDSGL